MAIPLSNPNPGQQSSTPHNASNNIHKIVDLFQKTVYKAVTNRPYHVEKRDEQGAYSRLMTHVDRLEARNKAKQYWEYFNRAASVAVFFVLTAALYYCLTVEPTNRKRLLRQRLWQWIAMAIMVTGVFSVVPFVTFILSCIARLWFKKTHKYAVYFIRQMKRSVDVTLWFCLVLLGWYAWFRVRLKHVHGELSVIIVSQITRLLIALCIGSLLWTLKNGLYLKLKADLHYDQLFDRITQSIVYLNSVLVLDRPLRRQRKDVKIWADFLAYNYNYKKKTSSGLCWEERRPLTCDNIWMDVREMKRESVPIWILRRLSEEYLEEVKQLRPHNADDMLKDDETLLTEAKQMLHRITGPNNLSEIRREHLSKEEYGLSQEELDDLFKTNLFEDGEVNNNTKQVEENTNNEDVDLNPNTPQGDNESKRTTQQEEDKKIDDKTIDEDKFLNWLVRAHKNCWSLERTLHSSNMAFVKLDRMLSAFILVLVVIIWLLLSKIVDTAQLALLFAPFLAASFMFENSSKNMFQGIIFAFAMHPFDVGDRVIIENIEMRVKVMHILTSVFIKYDTGAEVIYPNSKLAITKIVNLDITPDQSDSLEFVIEETPLEDVKDLEIKIQKLLDEDLRYASETKVVKSIHPEKRTDLKMTVHFKYLVSYLPAEIKATHRSNILTMIMKLCKEMKANPKEYPLEYVPFDLEMTTPKKVKMKTIELLKDQVLKSLDKKYKWCKVVITYLKDNEMKMGLFVSKLKEDEYPEDADIVTDELIEDKFFKKIDSLLPEWDFTNLSVSRGEHSIYPTKTWVKAFRRVSYKGEQTEEMSVLAAALSMSGRSTRLPDSGNNN